MKAGRRLAQDLRGPARGEPHPQGPEVCNQGAGAVEEDMFVSGPQVQYDYLLRRICIEGSYMLVSIVHSSLQFLCADYLLRFLMLVSEYGA